MSEAQDDDWSAEELTDDEWRRLIAHSLRDELNHTREDVYTLADGSPPAQLP